MYLGAIAFYFKIMSRSSMRPLINLLHGSPHEWSWDEETGGALLSPS
ncbi:MAG: hypothetical protein QXR65_06230 [Candidatus Bathyarchaeia archaeon]|nr:hypothetical protein [Candidatus Bathyarchaeota archaeon]